MRIFNFLTGGRFPQFTLNCKRTLGFSKGAPPLLPLLPFLLLLLLLLLILHFLPADAFLATVSGQTRYNLERPLKICWEFPFDKQLTNTIASDNVTLIYSLSSDGFLKGLNFSDGREIWKSELGGKTHLEPVVDKNNLYIVNSYENADKKYHLLRSISGLTGLTNWQTEIEAPGRILTSASGLRLLIVSGNGKLSLFDKERGTLVWSRQTPEGLTAAAIFGENRVIVSGNEKIDVISMENGNSQKTIETPKTAVSLYSGDEKTLFFGDASGGVYALDLTDGKVLWNIKTGGSVSSLSGNANGVLVTSFDNFVYFFSSGDGNLLWKRRVSSRITVKPLLFENYAVIVSLADSGSTILDLKTGKIVNRVLLEGENYFDGTPVKLDDFLIFRTIRGIYAYGLKPGGCSLKQ